MRTPRVFLPVRELPSGLLDLPVDESRHLVRVLRRRVGDRLVILTEGGRAAEGEIAAIEDSRQAGQTGPCAGIRVRVRILGASAPASSPLLPWTVAAAPVKGGTFEAAVRTRRLHDDRRSIHRS